MNNIQKAFKTKSKLRGMADGGQVDPHVLGTGMAQRAGAAMQGRRAQLDAAIDAASGAPPPRPAPIPVTAAPAKKPEEKSALRTFFGLADGGQIFKDTVGGITTFTDTRAAAPTAKAYTPGQGGGTFSVISTGPSQAAASTPAPLGKPSSPLATAVTPSSTPTLGSELDAAIGRTQGVTSPQSPAAGVGTSTPQGRTTFNSMSQAAAANAAQMRDLGVQAAQAAAANVRPAELPMASGNSVVAPELELADGGKVKGKGGPTDDKVGPVMLSDGEYVLPADTVDIVGRDKLDALRLATHTFVDDSNKPKVSNLRKMADGGAFYVDPDGVASRQLPPGRAMVPYQPPTAVAPYQPPTTMGPYRPPTSVVPSRVIDGEFSRVTGAPKPPALAAPGSAPPASPPPASPPPASAASASPPPASAASASPPPARPSVGSILRSTAGRGLTTLGGVLALSDGVRSMANEGLTWVNGGDTASGLALLAQAAGRAHPVPAAGATGWMMGRAIGDSLDIDTQDVIGGTMNTIVRDTGQTVNKGLRAIGIDTDIGADWGVDDSHYLESKAAAGTASQPRPAAAPQPRPVELPGMSNVPADVRTSSAGIPATPVQPMSYQSRRLAEMGVPLDQQNLAPVTEGTRRSLLREGGGTPGQYVNLGSYGGDANVYGTSSRPGGRIDSFAGVGASARPGGGPQEDPIMGEIRSALRDLTDGAGNRGGRGGSTAFTRGAIDEINKRYDAMLRNGAGQNRVRGLDWSQRHGLDVERARASELGEFARNQTALRGQDMQASTAANSASMQARMQALQTLGAMANQHSQLSAQARDAQLKALQDAQKAREDRMEDSAKVFESVADTFAGGDKGKASQYRELLATLPPELHQTAQGLAPEDKRAFYTNIVRQQLGRNDGLVLGRDMGATVQNAAIGGLLGRMTRFGSGAGGKAVDRALGKIPRVGPLLSALRPVENLSRFGTIIGAAGGAYATPKVENLIRWDPVARDPVSGAALPARQDVREAATYGAFDTYLNPFDHSVQTVSGRRTDRPTPDEEEAARRFRSALRN